MKKLEEKKKKLAIKLSKNKIDNFAYRIEDHKGNIQKEGGSKEGLNKLRVAKGMK